MQPMPLAIIPYFFRGSDWSIGNTIEVIATYNSNQEINSTIADDSGSQTVNVTFTFEIPQFGDMMGLYIVMIIVGVIAVASLRKKLL